MSKVTILAALFAVLNFSLTLATPAHAHPGCQSICSVLLEEGEADDGECDGEECDDKDCDDKDCEGEGK